jgi:hypothetical protein
MFGGLILAVRSTDTTTLFAPNGVGPLGHMIPYGVGLIGFVVLWSGLRSREFRVLWRRLS